MKRSEFDHSIRAAGSIIGESEILVIGSQAIHGSVHHELPEEAQRSIEVDIAALDDVDNAKADLIDGSIGEASAFHETFGYYAEGVSGETAVLPDGWEDRLVRYESSMTNGIVAWCLELHDLWLSKAVAGRPKDLEFCHALVRDQLVDRVTLLRRAKSLPHLPDPVRTNVDSLIDSVGPQR